MGDLSFDDWYETPVFEVEPDERLEQLATSRRAPLRLVAGAILRVAPRRPRKERGKGAVEPAPVEPAPVEPVEPVEAAPVHAVEAAPVQAVEAAPVQAVEPAPVQAVEPAPVQAVEPAPVEAAPGAAGSWRDRTGRFLDRWAALETASQDRIEALVLPKRWRG